MTVSADKAPQPAVEPVLARPKARTPLAPVPQVNLLPPEILASRRFRALQLRLAAAALGVVALCGAAVWWTQQGVDEARESLETVQAQGAQLQAQQAKYAGVPKALAELDEVKAAREKALATDVAWYRFLSDLAVNTPAGTQLSTVTISMTGGTDAKANPVPLSTAGLGTVTVTGLALKFPDVAAWLDEVNQVHGLAGSSFETATKEDTQDGSGGAASDSAGSGPAASGSAGSGPAGSGSAGSGSAGSDAGGQSKVIKFNGTAVVVPAALSHRYDRKAS